MRDQKAFASLSSGLLARKGQARPAMRPQGFGFGHAGSEDLGWNDMGDDVPARGVPVKLPADLSGPQPVVTIAPEVPPVVRQQEEIAREFAADAPVAGPELPPTLQRRTGGRKAAFTLRLDAERHLRLRLACAVQGRSAQLIVTDALDRLLDQLPDVARLAASLPGHD